jgi:hypothetical protein
MPELAPALSQSIDYQIISLAASGASQREIGQAVGLAQPCVSKRAAKPDIRRQIEELSRQFAQDNAARIIDIQAKAIASTQDQWTEIRALQANGDTEGRSLARKVATEAKDLLDAGDKIVKRAAQSMGLNPSPAPSVFLQAVFQGPANVILGDSMALMLGQAARQISQDDPDDGDIIDLE